MEKILSTVEAMQAELDTIKAETIEAQEKGVFSYGRSKTIRKSALEIAKSAKELRTIALDTFKASKGE